MPKSPWFVVPRRKRVTKSGIASRPKLSPRRRLGRRLGLEWLEDRSLLATIAWDGGTTGTGTAWSTAANWVGDVLPGSGDDVTIGTGYAVTSSSNVTVNSLVSDSSLTISNGTFTVNSASSINNTLSITGGTANINYSGPFAVYALSVSGTLTGPATVNVSGLTTWSGGTMSGLGMTNANGGMTISGSTTLARTVNNLGTAIVTATSMNANGGTFNNLADTGIFDIRSNFSFTAPTGGTFNNAGSLIRSTGTGTAVYSSLFNNTGTVEVQAGNLQLATFGTDTGPYTVLAGASLQFSGGTKTLPATSTITGAGSVSFTGATITMAGNYDIGTTTTITAGTVNFNGPITNLGTTFNVSGGAANVNSIPTTDPATFSSTGTANLNFSGPFNVTTLTVAGILTGPATVNVSGLTTWNSGAMSGAGVTNANGGMTISGDITLTGRTINNVGTAIVTGTGGTWSSGGIFNNLTGATYDIRSNASFNSVSGATFNNAGSLIRSAGTGLARFNFAFNNTGTVLVQTGNFLVGGGTDTGSYSIQAGASLDFDNSRTLAAASSVTGAGTVLFTDNTNSNSTVTIGGSYDVTGATSVSRGTANFNSPIASLGATFNVTSGVANVNSDPTTDPTTFNLSGGTANLNFSDSLDVTTLIVSGTLTGPATVNVSGLTTWNSGAMSGAGVTNANGGMTISGDITLTGRTINNVGTAIVTGTGGTWSSGGIFNNLTGATYDIRSNASFNSVSGATFNNAGSLIRSAGTGLARFNFAFNNTGTVLVQTGSFAVGGGGTDTGSYSVQTGASLDFNGGRNLAAATSVTGAGTVLFTDSTSSNGIVTIGGSYGVTGVTSVSGGTANFNSPIASLGATFNVTSGVANVNSDPSTDPTTFNLSGGTANLNFSDSLDVTTLIVSGTLTGPATVNVSGLTTWNSGAMSGAGVTNANGGMTISGNPALTGRTINNAGTAIVTGLGGTWSSSVFNNLATGTFDIRDNSGYNTVSGATFNNAGSLIRSAGTGLARFNFAFNNTGTVLVQTGSFAVGGGGTDTGSYSVQTGASLDFDGGRNLAAATSVTGAGTVLFTNGTVTIGGSYGVTGITSVSGGTANFNSPIASLGATFNVNSGTANVNSDPTIEPTTFTIGLGNIGGGIANINYSGTLDVSTLTVSGTLTGAATVNVSGITTWNGGAMTGTGITNANGGMTISGNPILTGRTVNNAGTAIVTGTGGTWSSSVFNNLATGTFDIRDNVGIGYLTNGSTFNNAGTLIRSAGTGLARFTFTFNNTGTVTVQTGTFQLNGTPQVSGTSLIGGTWNVLANATLDLAGIANLTTNQATVTLSGVNSNFPKLNTLATNAGTLSLLAGRSFTTTGAGNNYTQTAGATILGGGATLTPGGGTANLNGGSLSGSGTIAGNLVNAGLVTPGGPLAAGTINVTGSYTQTAVGALNLEVGGYGAGSTFDQFNANGLATLNGPLNVSLINGFTPNFGDAFKVMNFGTHSGGFSAINGLNIGDGKQFNATFNPTDLTLGVGASPADLAISMTDSPDPILVGGNLTYTVTVTNHGPNAATGVSVVDTLPAFMDFVSVTSSQGNSSQSPGTVLSDLGTLDSGATATITIVVTATTAAEGTITNSAMATALGADSNSSDNFASTTTRVDPVADLSIVSLTDSPDPVLVGNALTYTFVVSNVGPSTAAGVVATDHLPANVSFSTATATQGVFSVSANVVTFSVGSLPANGSATFTIVVTPNAPAAGTISNSIGVASTATDPNPANNSATQSTVVIPDADLSVQITDSPDPVLVGTPLTYTITVTNFGPSLATGVTLTDVLPAGVSLVSATSSQGTVSGSSTLTGSLGSINRNATVTITVVVIPNQSGLLSDVATVAGNEIDPDNGDNTAAAATSAIYITDLSVSMSDSPDPVYVGAPITYTMVVTNHGPSLASGVTLYDGLPSQATFVSATSSQGAFTLAGTTAIYSVGDLASGASATFTLVLIPLVNAVPSLTNAATVTGPDTDPNPANNTSQTVTTVRPKADMSVSITDFPDPLYVEDVLTYRVTVTNNGPSTATGVVFTDVLPANVAFQVGSFPAGSVSEVNGVVTANLGTFPSGASTIVTIVVIPNGAAAGTLLDTAHVTANEFDLDLSNNDDSEETTVLAKVDLGVTLVDSPDPVDEGSILTYTVVVSNGGPSAAAGATLTDVLPAGVTLVDATPSQGSCTGTSTIVCDLGSIAAGRTATVTIRVIPVDNGTLTNAASVTGSDLDTDLTNNSATTGTTVNNVAPAADLQANIVTYGQTATAMLANPFDPSTADTNAGLHFAFSLDNDTTGSATYANTTGGNLANFGVINAGTHTVYGRIIDKDNGSTEYVGSLFVNKADAQVSVSGYSGIYDAAAHGATGSVTGVDAGGVATGSSLDLGDSFTNVPGGIAHWTFTGGTNYLDESGDVAIDIAKATSITTVTIVGGPFTYNGSAQTPATVTVTGAGGLSLTPTADYANNVNAGTATASYSYAGDANHEPSIGSADFAIAKATSTTTVTIVGGPFTYNGLAQTPATVTVTGAGGLSLTPTADYANNVSAGTATASYSFAGDANHEPSAGSADFAIAKATSTTTVTIVGGPFTYDGSAQTPATVTVTGAGGLSLTPTADYANNVSAGTATASYSYAGDANHEPSTGSADFAIAKATSTTIVTIVGGPFTYNGSAQTPATVSVVGAGGLSLTPTADYANNVNAGTATASYSYAGDANHEPSSGSADFAIAKATSTTTVTIVGGPFTYNGSAQTPATVSVVGAGGLSLTPTADYANNVNAGTATASYSYAGDANHEPSAGSADFAIAKATSTTTVTIVGGPFTYNGSAQTPATVSVVGAGGLSLTPTADYANNVNAGTATASYSYAGDANHEPSAGSADFAIAKATSTTTVTIVGGPFTYNGSAQTPATVSVVGAGGLSLTPTADYANNVNAGTATASYSYAGDANHEPSSGSADFAIAKANAAVTVTGYSGTYDAAAHGATGSVTGVNAGGAATGSSLNLGNSSTNAPGGTAHWTFTGGTNYLDKAGDVAIEIVKANAIISVTPYSVTYDGSSHTATGTATGVGGVDLSASLNLSRTKHTSAGTYNGDVWTFAGGINYSDANGAVNDNIANDNQTPKNDVYVAVVDNKGGSSITSSIGTLVPGTSFTYTITVGNNGPNTATSVAISDPMPSGLTAFVWSGNGKTNQSGAIGDTIASLAPGATVVYTVTATLSASATAQLVNIVTANAANDTNAGNNSTTDKDNLTPQADLAVTIADGTGIYTAGASTTYTMVVSNNGFSAVTGATVKDTLPAAITSDTWTATASTGGSVAATSGSGSINTTVSLAPGATITFTVIAQISATVTGNLVNTATVAAPSGVTDTNPGNNSATDTDTPGGKISGTKYLDVTGNGMTSDDTPLSGVTLYVDLNNNGALDSNEPKTVTAANGAYAFTGLASGTYYVREVVPSGFIRTSPALSDNYQVTLATGQASSGNDFANAEMCDKSILSGISYLINGSTTVSDLRDHTNQGDLVTVKFTVDLPAGVSSHVFTLVSYTAPGASFDANVASQQEIYDTASINVTADGTYSLTVLNPNGYFQVDFVCGEAIDTFGPAGSNIFYSAQNRLFSADNDGTKACSTSQSIATGDFAAPSFWCGSKGQALIKAFDGSSSSTELARWLATSFPNLYGPGAGNHAMVATNGSYLTNTQIAANFSSKFSGNDQQVLATALSIYATSSYLEGSSAASKSSGYGLHVTNGGSAGDYYSVGSKGSSFGVANNTKLAVIQLLEGVNANTSLGSSVSSDAGSILSAINTAGKVNANSLSDAELAFSPSQVRTAYGINGLTLDGTGQTIAIVDAYHNPDIFVGVDAFDTQFSATDGGATLFDQYGSASSFLTVIGQNGAPDSLPDTDPAGAGTVNWEMEAALDVQWVHAMAPGAKIILVEANSPALADLMAAVGTAARQPNVSVVSISWGFYEGLSVVGEDEALYDHFLTTPEGHIGVTFVASTGDYGAAIPQYPSFSPNVVAVGGTSLSVNGDSSYASESGWGSYNSGMGTFFGSGGGISQFEAQPDFQSGVQSTGFRTTPDVSFVADPSTGVWIADPYNLSADAPWLRVGGTSLSAPAWAGLLAVANQGRVAAGGATLGTSGPTEAQTALYSVPQSDYNAITSGTNGYSAGAGYNLVTGLGTPVANLLITDLVAYDGVPLSGTPAGQQPISAENLTFDPNFQGFDATSDGGRANARTNAFAVFNAEVISSLLAVGSRNELVLPHNGLTESAAGSLLANSTAVPVSSGADFSRAFGLVPSLNISSGKVATLQVNVATLLVDTCLTDSANRLLSLQFADVAGPLDLLSDLYIERQLESQANSDYDLFFSNLKAAEFDLSSIDRTLEILARDSQNRNSAA